MSNDKRLIEDYLPIVAISAEASREKSVRKGHISTLHLWWARRPLVACRAAVYGALVPASRFVPNAGSDEKKKSLGRANAAKFVERLCKYPGNAGVIAEAQGHILEAHAERLTEETGKKVTVEDIVAGKAPRPKVLDMFAGGGAIPLEALRLGCEAYALDLNPVAHIIQLCTLVYPQKYGKPDPTARGMTGPKNAKGETTWGGLADEVRYWGEWVLKKVKAEIGDLYPLIPDPEHKGKKQILQADYLKDHATDDVPPGYLMPVAYLWTRTVICKNPNCKATVPLVKQTWLCKKDKRYIALKMIAPRGKKQVHFEVVEAGSEAGLGFDPTGFSKGGNAACPFCGTVADSDHVKAEGFAERLDEQLMAIVCSRPGRPGRVYISADSVSSELRADVQCRRRLELLLKDTGLSVPTEPIINDAKGALFIVLYGITKWGQIFNDRQLVCLLTFIKAMRLAEQQARSQGFADDHIKAANTVVSLLMSKIANRNSTQSMWQNTAEKIGQSFGRQTLAMVWDFVESNPLGVSSGSASEGLDGIVDVMSHCASISVRGTTVRSSATSLPWEEETFDAVITDPPYYDNVPYADISDFFYVWLKRAVGHLHSEHFAAEGTPKKGEAVADATRHGGDKVKAKRAYEDMMAKAFQEAGRVLKPTGEMAVVYAHKTTLGWATLVDAMRRAGFTVTEAWPLDTEMKGRLRGMESAALASSIFLVARKREGAETGNFEVVKPELEQIVRERVETLWDMGISGADLVIACVGAGLRAFTRFARVEYANGEEVPAERFLTEVETVVLETILARLSKEVGGKTGQTGLAGLDPATRFYVLWRYTYGAGELDAGEAIIFANGTHVELDGHAGLASGSNAVLEKIKAKYRLLDFTTRGDDEKLGVPGDDGIGRPVVDMLHRLLWLLEHKPPKIPDFLADAKPNLEQLKLVCQALGGPALKGGELKDVSPTAEQSTLGKLLANWSAVMEGQQVKTDKKAGQERLL
ncbi:MAG: DUF1156 domain-containing protein [Verrucomicrobiota bacterium]